MPPELRRKPAPFHMNEVELAKLRADALAADLPVSVFVRRQLGIEPADKSPTNSRRRRKTAAA